MITAFFGRMKGREKSPERHSHSTILWSFIGGFLGIYLVSLISKYTHNQIDSLFLVGSFGASAVLMYGAPHAEFSQPRNVIGGHVISAFVGVTLYKFVPIDIEVLGALAVACSIAAMHYIRALHPPGGATGLIAVIGSEQIHQQGYMFVLSPILTGVVLMLLVALFVNNISGDPKRHYPKYWF